MAEKLDPKERVTIEEVVASHMFEIWRPRDSSYTTFSENHASCGGTHYEGSA